MDQKQMPPFQTSVFEGTPSILNNSDSRMLIVLGIGFLS